MHAMGPLAPVRPLALRNGVVPLAASPGDEAPTTLTLHWAEEDHADTDHNVSASRSCIRRSVVLSARVPLYTVTRRRRLAST